MNGKLALVYRKRLLKLAEFLEALPRKKFDYRFYATSEEETIRECPTTACAIGWACTMPTFKRLGAYLTVDRFLGLTYHLTYHFQPQMKGAEDEGEFAVGEQIFGLSVEEFDYLFNPYVGMENPGKPGPDATPKQVAKHIRKFVEAQS